MQKILRRVRALVGNMLTQEPMIGTRAHAGTDWLPPVLGPADWSHGLIASMADSSTAWYFGRR